MQDALQARDDALACRDAAIADLKAQLARAQEAVARQREEHTAALRTQEQLQGNLRERDGQLEAAQARLGQVAPIMRRLAARAHG